MGRLTSTCSCFDCTKSKDRRFAMSIHWMTFYKSFSLFQYVVFSTRLATFFPKILITENFLSSKFRSVEIEMVAFQEN